MRREQTRAACAAEALPVWDDPHNADPRFTRARLRAEVLPLLEDVLAGGVAVALARTAELLRDDLDALTSLAAATGPAAVRDGTVDAVALAAHPPAVRTRVLRDWLRAAGVPAPASAAAAALDALRRRLARPGPGRAARRVGRPAGCLAGCTST